MNKRLREEFCVWRREREREREHLSPCSTDCVRLRKGFCMNMWGGANEQENEWSNPGYWSFQGFFNQWSHRIVSNLKHKLSDTWEPEIKMKSSDVMSYFSRYNMKWVKLLQLWIPNLILRALTAALWEKWDTPWNFTPQISHQIFTFSSFISFWSNQVTFCYWFWATLKKEIEKFLYNFENKKKGLAQQNHLLDS